MNDDDIALLRRGPLHDRPLCYAEKVGLWTSRDGKVYIPDLQIPVYNVLSTLAAWGFIEDKVARFMILREERKHWRIINEAKRDEQRARDRAIIDEEVQKRLRETEARCRVD